MKVSEQAHAAIVKDYSWRRYVERISDVYQTLTQ
jgi:glycosyltransferase involved in cell wall biosynthesis